MLTRIHEIINIRKTGDRLSFFYDLLMMFTIIISIAPMMFKHYHPVFTKIEIITVTIFVFDYILRILTAQLLLNKGLKSYLFYPFTPFAIIDILSILPSLNLLLPGFKILRLLRVFKTFRVFKMLRYSRNFDLVLAVFKKESSVLLAILVLAFGYIFIAALVIFSVEPEIFDSFFEATYWSVTALTTVGYGDIYPVSTAGRIVSMISSIFGVAMVALPSGVITAGFLEEIKDGKAK